MTTDWPFAENYRAEFQGLPPTQIKEAQKRLAKKGVVDMAAPSEDTRNIIQAVFAAYSKKKERARAASSKSRAAKSAEAEPEEPAIDIEVEPTEEAACVVSEVVAEPEPPAEEPAAAAPPTKAASIRAAKRDDNVAQGACRYVAAAPRGEVAPAPKRPVASEAPTRRRGGLCEMVSNALPGVDVARTSSA